jgi:hypothetical protein
MRGHALAAAEALQAKVVDEAARRDAREGGTACASQRLLAQTLARDGASATAPRLLAQTLGVAKYGSRSIAVCLASRSTCRRLRVCLVASGRHLEVAQDDHKLISTRLVEAERAIGGREMPDAHPAASGCPLVVHAQQFRRVDAAASHALHRHGSLVLGAGDGEARERHASCGRYLPQGI